MVNKKNFMDKMNFIADEYKIKNSSITKNMSKEDIKIQFYKNLTNKYYDDIKKSIFNNSKKGITEIYYNINSHDFQYINDKNVKRVCKNWLDELCNPDSKYLEEKECLYGLKYKIKCKIILLIGAPYKLYYIHFKWGTYYI